MSNENDDLLGEIEIKSVIHRQEPQQSEFVFIDSVLCPTTSTASANNDNNIILIQVTSLQDFDGNTSSVDAPRAHEKFDLGAEILSLSSDDNDLDLQVPSSEKIDLGPEMLSLSSDDNDLQVTTSSKKFDLGAEILSLSSDDNDLDELQVTTSSKKFDLGAEILSLSSDDNDLDELQVTSSKKCDLEAETLSLSTHDNDLDELKVISSEVLDSGRSFDDVRSDVKSKTETSNSIEVSDNRSSDNVINNRKSNDIETQGPENQFWCVDVKSEPLDYYPPFSSLIPETEETGGDSDTDCYSETEGDYLVNKMKEENQVGVTKNENKRTNQNNSEAVSNYCENVREGYCNIKLVDIKEVFDAASQKVSGRMGTNKKHRKKKKMSQDSDNGLVTKTVGNVTKETSNVMESSDGGNSLIDSENTDAWPVKRRRTRLLHKSASKSQKSLKSASKSSKSRSKSKKLLKSGSKSPRLGVMFLQSASELSDTSNDDKQEPFQDEEPTEQMNDGDNDGLNYLCEICKLSYANLRDLKTHMLKNHPETAKQTLYKCKICGKYFVSWKGLKRHSFRIHKKSVQLECKECEKCFATRVEMRSHWEREHRKLGDWESDKINIRRAHDITKRAKRVACELCEKVFPDKWKLATHMTTHSNARPYQCPICERGFKHSGALSTHVKCVHEGQKYKKKKCVCDLCGKLYFDKSSLNRHMQRLHTVSEPVDPETRRVHQCEYCGKRYIRKEGLDDHVNKQHSDKTGKLKLYECQDCDKVFKDRTRLYYHKKIHLGTMRKCGDCGKLFDSKSHFDRHMRSHKGQKNHKCKDCGKLFINASNLRIHERTHGGVKEFMCSVCGQGFYQKSNLKSHLRRKHKL